MGLFSSITKVFKKIAKPIVTSVRTQLATFLPIIAPGVGGLAVNLLGIAPRTRGPASVAFQQQTLPAPTPQGQFSPGGFRPVSFNPFNPFAGGRQSFFQPQPQFAQPQPSPFIPPPPIFAPRGPVMPTVTLQDVQRFSGQCRLELRGQTIGARGAARLEQCMNSKRAAFLMPPDIGFNVATVPPAVRAFKPTATRISETSACGCPQGNVRVLK